MCGQTCLNYPKQKFSISLQNLKKEVNDKVDFLHAGKHENVLQIDALIMIEMVKHFQSSKNSNFTMSVQYLIKEDRNEVDFLYTDKNQSSLQVDFKTLGTRPGYKGYYDH